MKHILVILALTAAVRCNAQFSSQLTGNQLVNLAAAGAVVVVERQYQLIDTISGQYFGRHGELHFGATASLAAKTNIGLIMTNEAVEPWNYDDNYNRYRDTHRPALYKAFARTADDTTTVELTTLYNTEPRSLIDRRLYFVDDTTTYRRDGLAIDTSVGQTQGWLLWLTSPDADMHHDSTVVVSVRKTFDITADEPLHDIDPPQTIYAPRGGIFVTCQCTAVGKLQFRLAGVILHTADGSWQLATPFANFSIEAEEQPADTTTELTPIAPKKSNRKHKQQ